MSLEIAAFVFLYNNIIIINDYLSFFLPNLQMFDYLMLLLNTWKNLIYFLVLMSLFVLFFAMLYLCLLIYF